MGDEAYVPVPEFYAGKSVFITGGAGYLGKVLLEKLLYSCPKVDKVYVLLRDKGNVKAEQRLRIIKDLPVFNRLRNKRPQDLDKIILTKGDVNVYNMNMNTEDLDTVIEKVSVVFHCAATINFKEPLKIALETNVEGTRNVLNLCRLMKNLQVFVHLSTAYSNGDKPVIEEKVYPPPVPIQDVYKFVEQEDPDEAKTAKYIGRHPNTYTFSKALAEHLISETHGDIPAVIVRPSIVSPSKDEPVNGWVDNWFGATAFITTVIKGICRVVYTSEDHILDLIPVDYVCNLTLIVAARAKPQKQVAVYNSCSGSTNPLTMKQARRLCSQATVKEKFNDFPYPNLIVITKRYWLVKLINMLILIAAYIADLLTRLAMKRPKYTKLATQTVMVGNVLQFFTSNSWLMKTDNSHTLYESLSAADVKLFPCLARDINWKEYLHIYLQGIKKYLMIKKKE